MYNIPEGVFDEKVLRMAEEAERDCEEKGLFRRVDGICLLRSAQILSAFQEYKVSTADFIEITGYGYYDGGREKLEKIYSRIFGCEDALVRVQMMSGTHAICLALRGLLKHGDTLLAVSGAPYETLQSVIGTVGGSRNSLIACGVNYEQIDLSGDEFDLDAIEKRIRMGGVKVAHIQRSRGYAARRSLTVEKIGQAIKVIKKADPGVTVFVDNCYGEFTEEKEPTHVGADLIVGSMMKNPGGGIAVSGAYCAGRADLISDIAEQLTAPCIGKELGANFGQLTSFYKGLFLAPSVTGSAVKTAIFAARLLELAGFQGVSPKYDEVRTDIVQTADLMTADNLVRFCRGLQSGAPVESYVTPEPGYMPGYQDMEIMAGGSFTVGSTIELSGDGPLVPPYTVYMQGGLTYEYGKLGVMRAVETMMKEA